MMDRDWDLLGIDPNGPYAEEAEKCLTDAIWYLRAFRFTSPNIFGMLKLPVSIEQLEQLDGELLKHLYPVDADV